MVTFYDKSAIYQVLNKKTNLFGYPKVKDKLEALDRLKHFADLEDVQYIFPIVFDKNNELATRAAEIVAEIMDRVTGKQWNNLYDRVKYTSINIEELTVLLKFPTEISVHLVGVSSLNMSGYIREKALKLISGLNHSKVFPYMLLRLNDWVEPVRLLAMHILKNILTANNISILIDNSYLIEKMQKVTRVDLKSIRQEIVDYLKDDSVKEIIKANLKHPNVKSRLFCFMILKDKIADEDIIDIAIKDKSFEIRLQLIEAIHMLKPKEIESIIVRLFTDKSARVRVAVLRSYEELICEKYKYQIEDFLLDEHFSVRDIARYMAKKHLSINDFPQYYKDQIQKETAPGAILGLGETGSIEDYSYISQYLLNENSKIKIAAMLGAWYLSKERAVQYVLDSLNSEIPRVRKTAKRILKDSKMPEVFLAMRDKLKSNDTDQKIFALNMIFSFGSWPALDSILFIIAYDDNDEVLIYSKFLLDKWLVKASRLYTMPDSLTQKKIAEYLEIITSRNLLSDKILREIKFIIESRK